MNTISGVGASAGISIGPAFLYRGGAPKVERFQIEDVDAEWERLKAAIQDSRTQLEELGERLKSVAKDELAEIFKMEVAFRTEIPQKLRTVLFAPGMAKITQK